MSQTIHFGEKHRTSLMNYFATQSDTENAFSHSLDMEFVGSDTVKVTEVATDGLSNYDKTVDPSKGSRFGAVSEVGDYQYTFQLTQDVSLDRTIDRGNNNAQFNMKKVGQVMKAYMDKVIKPYVDSYRLGKWTKEAGIHYGTAAPTKATIAEQIITLHNLMTDAGVPEDGCRLYISREWMPTLKLSNEWVGLDSLGGKTLPKGFKGEFDGMAVKPVSSRKFPKDCYFAIFHKDSIIAPRKINTFRGIKDSENMDGDRLQFRMKHDAFVIPSLADGAAVACVSAKVLATPTIAVSSGKATVTVADGAAAYYTLDGSDPRYQSADVKVYSAAVVLPAGSTIRVCAKKDGMWTSAVAEATNA